jgi:putative ABC transport system permease protein
MTVSALKATARIAWRDGRRHLRRSSLIFVMIGLPVALVTAGATIARTSVATPQEEIAGMMGSADLVIQSPGRSQVARLERNLPEGSEVLTVAGEDLPIIQDGKLIYAALVEPDGGLDSPMLKGHYELRSGRVPRAPGEVAIQENLLEGFHANIGDEVELGGYKLQVVGTARYPYALDFGLAVVGPGTLQNGTPISRVLVDLPAGENVGELNRFVDNISLTRSEVGDVVVEDAKVWETVSFVGGVLALFGTGLIAAAAFVVGARRQLRDLGIIGAAGGEPRHARSVVLLTGTILGLAGALMGCVAGLGLAYLVHPFLDGLIGRVVGPIEINPLVIAGAILMGTLAATVAAFGPARSVAKLSVTEALAGRSAQHRPPGRVAAFGAILLVGGGVVAAWATVSDSNVVLAGGLIGMLLGVLLAIPMLVAVVGKVAALLPLSPRLAARDAARHGRRTGAAVAAAVIALGIPIAVGTYSLGEETFERQSPRLGDDQLYFGTVDGGPAVEPDGLSSDVDKAFTDSVLVPLRNAVVPSKRSGGQPSIVVAFGVTDDTPDTLLGFDVFVGDSDLLRAIHAEGGENALAQGKAVVVGGFRTENGFVRVETPLRPGRGVKVPAVSVPSPAYFLESIPRIVISKETASELGLGQEDLSQYLLTTPRPVSSEDIDLARGLAAEHPGFHVLSAEDYLPRFALVRAAVTAASVPLGLAILAVAVALVVSESRRSHQILAAVGAGPMTYRKVVASTSALLALIAAVLAVPAGILPTLVVQASSAGGRPLVIPWATIATVVFVAPLVSGVLAALLSRSPRLGSLLIPST